jgi:hypothetical protein
MAAACWAPRVRVRLLLFSLICLFVLIVFQQLFWIERIRRVLAIHFHGRAPFLVCSHTTREIVRAL